MDTITRDHYELHLSVLRETLRGLIVAHGLRVTKSYLHCLLSPATGDELRAHMEFLRSGETRDEWLRRLTADQPSLLPEGDPPAPIVPEDPVETEPDMGYTR